ERHETDRFEAANATLTDTSVRIGRLFVIMGPAITVVLHLATAAVLWFGGHRVDAGLVQVGALTAFMQYLLHERAHHDRHQDLQQVLHERGHDGHVHADDVPARDHQRAAHPGGARH